MKFAILLLSILLLQKDEYYVSHITGKVIFAKTGKLLFIGDEISLSDSLIFSSKNDVVAVVSPQKGRLVILPDHVKNTHKASGLLLAVRDNFFPEIKTNTMATRAGLINNLSDFESYLQQFTEDSTNLLVIDSLKIPLSTTYFDNRDSKFFFIRYLYKGETINKKLKYIEPANVQDTLYLFLDGSIFSIDGKKIPADSVKNASVFYYEATAEKSIEAGSVKMKFLTQKEIMPEINVLVKSLGQLYHNQPDKQHLIADDIQLQMRKYYGFIDEDEIEKLIPNLK